MLAFRLIILKYFSFALYVNAAKQSGMPVWQLCYVYEISNLQLAIVLIKPFLYFSLPLALSLSLSLSLVGCA